MADLGEALEVARKGPLGVGVTLRQVVELVREVRLELAHDQAEVGDAAVVHPEQIVVPPRVAVLLAQCARSVVRCPGQPAKRHREEERPYVEARTWANTSDDLTFSASRCRFWLLHLCRLRSQRSVRARAGGCGRTLECSS